MKIKPFVLNGLRILNTRPAGQNQTLSQEIIAAGGIPITLPALVIEPTEETWVKQLPDLSHVDGCIFISANAVNYFFINLKKYGLTWPNTIKTIAIGRATAHALTNWSIRVDGIPKVADSDHLIQLADLQQIKGQTFLLIKGIGGKKDIAHTLLKRGATSVPFSVYRRVIPTPQEQEINALWKQNLVDILLFTSQEAMQNIFALFGPKAHAWLCSKPCLVISERLAVCAQTMGIKTVLVSPYEGLVSTLELYIKNTPR